MWKDEYSNELEQALDKLDKYEHEEVAGYTITMVDFENNIMVYEGVDEWSMMTDVWFRLKDADECKLVNIATIKEITIK